MVEGGRIDHGHHDGKPGYAMLEAQEFNRAVETALAKIDLEETLVIVTADHSHVFTMGGYATRGNPILGLVVTNDRSGEPRSTPALAADGVPYTTLAYANGPGAVTELPRTTPATGVGAIAQSLVPIASHNIDGSITSSETHGGEDVAVYATGPGADRVRGVIEQNLIYGIMTAALGWDR
jgi:alkaline phosphatase